MAKQLSSGVIPSTTEGCCQSLPIRMIQLGMVGGGEENYELREDGGIELRENGTNNIELRESNN